MKNDTQRLTDWVIRTIKTEYPDDVALLVAVEGASINGDGHGEPFDYFVPATERGNELAQTFIIGGVGNDLYPRSWERMERNEEIRYRHFHLKIPIDTLCEEYGLSAETVRKILYR